MKTYDTRIDEDGRLIILRELAVQIDGRSNEINLQRVLHTFGITRSREYVRTQLLKLAELGGVRTEEAGTVMIATLRKAGRNHVERYGVIDGVSRPSEED